MYHSFKVSSVLFCPSAHAGALYINGSLDFEASHEYYLSIEGTRKGSASLSDVTMVVINITDINDHAPEFIQDPYFADIREDAAVGEIILTVWLQTKPLSLPLHYALFALPLHFTQLWTQPVRWVCDIQHLRFRHDFKMDDCKDSQQPTDRADTLLQKAPLNEAGKT